MSTFLNDMKIGVTLKYYSVLLVIILAGSLAYTSKAAEVPAVNTSLPAKFPFSVGEQLIYRIYWGIIPVGQTIIKTEWIEENGKKLLAIRYRTFTNRIFDTIYPVDDTAESIVTPETFLPIRFSFLLTRRRSRTERTVSFDHANLKAVMASTATGQTNEFEIASDTRDIISFLYYSRSSELQPYQTRHCRVVADTGILDMKLKTYDYENVNIPPFGKVQSLRLDPIAKLDTLKVENGKVMSWIAKERCLATKMTIDAPLANVSIELREVNGPGADSWSKAMQKAHPDRKNAPLTTSHE